MTEAEWEGVHHPGRLIAAAEPRLTVRQRRLIAVAAWRTLPSAVLETVGKPVFDVADELAETGAPARLFPIRGRLAARRLRRLSDTYRDGLESALVELYRGDAAAVVRHLGLAAGRIDPCGYWEHNDMHLSDLVRDIAGPPRPRPSVDPTWRTATVRTLADSTYIGRDFTALPVLADALEDAGYDAADLLAHLRGPGPHARGCWALDLVLGKV